MRGTFANIRIKNEMLDGVEGGYTMGPDGAQTSIYDASMAYQAAGTPLVIFGGIEYGAGSRRDWAAKGTALLGVKAVIAEIVRAHPPLQPRRHGRHPVRIHRRRHPQVAGPEGRRSGVSIAGLEGDLKPLVDRALHHHLCRRHAEDHPDQVPHRYRDRDRIRRTRRRAALRAARPRRVLIGKPIDLKAKAGQSRAFVLVKFLFTKRSCWHRPTEGPLPWTTAFRRFCRKTRSTRARRHRR